jgi:hypothetical protein
VQRLAPVQGTGHLIALARQRDAQQLTYFRVVVDHQHAAAMGW